MDIDARLEANAILDRLVADGATFRRDDARRLIDLIPVARSSRFSFRGRILAVGPVSRAERLGLVTLKLKVRSG